MCTTELGAFAKLEPEFTKRNVKLIGLSANDLDSHGKWIEDIDEVTGSKLSFPIIGDAKREVAWLYDMVDHTDLANVGKGMYIALMFENIFTVLISDQASPSQSAQSSSSTPIRRFD